MEKVFVYLPTTICQSQAGDNVHGSFYYQENASENSFDASSLCRVKIQGEKGFQKATTNKTY